MLPELLVASCASTLLLVAVMAFFSFSGRNFAAMSNYADLDRYSRNALDTMSEQIRETRRLTAFSTTSLTFEDVDGQPLSFTYDAGQRLFKRVKGGAEEILLRECDFLKFEMFQRNPIEGAFSVYPATTTDTCKLVQVTWRCSRTVLGLKLNTESVQSAKVVIRKRRT